MRHGENSTEHGVETVIWRPNEHAEEYIVFIDDAAEFKQWKEDKSVALSRFIGQFAIVSLLVRAPKGHTVLTSQYKSQTSGHTGTLGEVSKQEIENVFFGDEKNVKDKSVEAAIQLILENGKLQPSAISNKIRLNTNPARGSGDTRLSHGGVGGAHR